MHPALAHRVVHNALAALILLAAASGQKSGAQQVRVVNVIPRQFGWEELDNSEATLAVRPGTPTELAVSTHLGSALWCNGANPLSGYFVSTTGGDEWGFACTPTSDETVYPFDPTVWFSGDGRTLYFGFLILGNGFYLRANDDFTQSDAIRSVVSPATGADEGWDQPQVTAFPGTSSRRVLIAMMGTSTRSEQMSCRVNLRVATAPTSNSDFSSNCIANRVSTENPFGIRIAAHSKGRVYVAYIHTRPDENVDFWDVVLQSGRLASGAPPQLDDLREPEEIGDSCHYGDGLLGVRVAKCVKVAQTDTHVEGFGWVVPLGSELSVAVDPADEQTVYVAWGDSARKGSPFVTLHVRKSTDGGKRWSQNDLLRVRNATNPALAVDSKGRLGFLFQRLVGVAPSLRWQTRLCITTLCTASRPVSTSLLLAETPIGASAPPKDPFLGDYVSLVAEGNSFFGVFSARNDPTEVEFPSGVTYHRACSGGSLRNEINGAVQPSVDPFYFRVQPDLPAVVPTSTQPAC